MNNNKPTQTPSAVIKKKFVYHDCDYEDHITKKAKRQRMFQKKSQKILNNQPTHMQMNGTKWNQLVHIKNSMVVK